MKHSTAGAHPRTKKTTPKLTLIERPNFMSTDPARRARGLERRTRVARDDLAKVRHEVAKTLRHMANFRMPAEEYLEVAEFFSLIDDALTTAEEAVEGIADPVEAYARETEAEVST